MHWSFWKFTDLGRFSKCWHMIICVINKSHLLISASVSLEELIKYPETFKLTVVDLCIWILQNSNFHLRIQILWRTTNTVRCFPWSDRLISLIFKKISARCRLKNRICLLYVLSSKNDVPRKSSQLSWQFKQLY